MIRAVTIEGHPTIHGFQVYFGFDWNHSWTEQDKLEPLTPEGWYEKGHGITGGCDDNHGIWIPTHGPSNELIL